MILVGILWTALLLILPCGTATYVVSVQEFEFPATQKEMDPKAKSSGGRSMECAIFDGKRISHDTEQQ